ncbi:hypothetical protein [Polaromonas sp. UC242_47]|uniref:hypothetical protein n=1 Tax=Polaromonas sp. UC242_47 TaxID=3374626 RepID=UPI0037A28765
MKFRVALLALESLALGGASTAAVVYGFPVMFGLGIATLMQAPATGSLGLLQLAGCAWAVVEFWHLAVKTTLSLPYSFGLRFWLGVFGATVGLVGFYGTMPLAAVSLFIGLPALGAAHFSFLQLRMRSRQTPSRVAT